MSGYYLYLCSQLTLSLSHTAFIILKFFKSSYHNFPSSFFTTVWRVWCSIPIALISSPPRVIMPSLTPTPQETEWCHGAHRRCCMLLTPLSDVTAQQDTVISGRTQPAPIIFWDLSCWVQKAGPVESSAKWTHLSLRYGLLTWNSVSDSTCGVRFFKPHSLLRKAGQKDGQDCWLLSHSVRTVSRREWRTA